MIKRKAIAIKDVHLGMAKLFWREILHSHDTFFFLNVTRKIEKIIPRWD
jgi:hypothetical protein